MVLAALTVALVLPSCGKDCPGRSGGAAGGGEIAGELRIFHAGSLSVPFRKVSAAFMKKHPHVQVKAEAAGSRDTARKVSDLGRACDVLGSADYKVVENLLMPRHAKFNVRFATNEISLVYSHNSARAGEVNARNWHDVLLRKNVRFGRSDPNRDPCGYRTEMLFQLAEKHYRLPALAERLRAKDGRRFIRPKETDLLVLLEAGEIDYLFIYRSVGLQHGLEVLRLPDEINLRDPEKSALYNTATVQVTGRKPGEFLTRTGEAIVYSVTIPLSSPNPRAAEAYVAFLLSPEGRKIIADCGQGYLEPIVADGWEHVPAAVRPYCKQR
jgi:molybdate/tungstate transport system substrate-binding protein